MRARDGVHIFGTGVGLIRNRGDRPNTMLRICFWNLILSDGRLIIRLNVLKP